MAQSILVFVSHSSGDKEALIEPIVSDLESCYINVWLDKRKIVPGENLRKSIFRDGLDKADVALIFFTKNSLKSSWVDKEIKHVLREETKKGNNFDLNKIISIFDTEETYNQIAERYPELTDDLLHLMPENYTSIHLGQLISAIWSKYLSLQGGDVQIQKQLLEKDKELFQKDKDIETLKRVIEDGKRNSKINTIFEEFEAILNSGVLTDFINYKDSLFGRTYVELDEIPNRAEASAFGFIQVNPKNHNYISPSEKGKDFFKWLILNKLN